jgi:hypothetical protein
MSEVSLRQQLEEVEYELGMRRKVYPRLASSGKERESVLEYHTKRMEAVAATLRRLIEEEEDGRPDDDADAPRA